MLENFAKRAKGPKLWITNSASTTVYFQCSESEKVTLLEEYEKEFGVDFRNIDKNLEPADHFCWLTVPISPQEKLGALIVNFDKASALVRRFQRYLAEAHLADKPVKTFSYCYRPCLSGDLKIHESMEVKLVYYEDGKEKKDASIFVNE